MPEISVKDQIKKLVELQKLDGEIYSLNKEATERPQEINELKEQFESTKAHLHELEENSKNIQVQRKEFELELQAKEDEITKANAQLSEIKTNKEYTAKITEIENIKADKSIIEEKILKSYDESDGVTEAIDKEKVNVAAEEKKFLEQKKEVEDQIKVIGDRVKVLESQKEQLTPEVDRSFLERYEKILKHKGGTAIVPVNGMACGGCYMNITPQMVNSIKLNDDLVTCEICSCILYLEEDL